MEKKLVFWAMILLTTIAYRCFTVITKTKNSDIRNDMVIAFIFTVFVAIIVILSAFC